MSKAIRRIPVAIWLGGALLAFSLGAVVLASNFGAHAAEDSSTPPKTASLTKLGAAYAYVDIYDGVANLYTLQPGRVVKIYHHDNDVVNKDDKLIQLDDTAAQADLVMAQAAVKVAENDLEKSKFLVTEHTEKLAGQTAAVAAKKSELTAAQTKRDHAKSAFTKNAEDFLKENLTLAEAAVSGYEEAVKIEEAKLRALQAYDPTIEQRNAAAQLQAKKALLAKAEFALKECTITAPDKGTVLRVLVAEGDVLGPNPRQPAVIFCPDKPRILRAEVEQEFAGRLQLDQTAVARDDSPNSPTFTGKVTRISDWFSHRRSMVQEPLQFNDVRTVECIITLDPSDKTPLRIGQRVRVTFEGKN